MLLYNHVGSALGVKVDKQNFALNFSSLEDVDYAFYRLSMFIKEIICNRFSAAGHANMYNKGIFLLLFVMLCCSIFWNFLDIRLLEAIALASMIPAAQKSVENYKQAFFIKKLSEVMREYQYLPFIKFIGERNEYLHEYFTTNYDFQQMTIGDFHKHRLYLETSLFHVGEGTFAFTMLYVEPRSFGISWQIHTDLIQQVLHTLNDNKKIVHNIAFFHIDELERWKDLPVLLRGVEKKIGPVELLEWRDEPYSLMKGFMWG